MARRRKEDGRVGSASRGMVRRLARFFSRVRPRVSQIARGGLSGAPPRGQSWTSAVTRPHGRNGLIAWRMAVLSALREPSLCRHVRHELLRSVLLDLTPIIAATACHQRNYVERYSRSITGTKIIQHHRASGGIRKLSNSSMVHTWSVSPAAMAGVTGFHFFREPFRPLVGRLWGRRCRKLRWGTTKG